MLNLAVILEQSARREPGKVALVLDDVKLRYAELNGAANKLANALTALDVAYGDKVALMLPNTPHFAIAYYGILKTGAAVVPLNVLFKRNEVQYHLEDSDAKVLIVWEGFLPEALAAFRNIQTCHHLIVVQAPGSPNALPDDTLGFNQLLAANQPTFELVPTGSDDTAVILYTSGTTGQPKGAELSHFNMFFNAMVGVEKLLFLQVDEVGLAVLPLFHSFGQTCVLNALIYGGATITMLPRFDPIKAMEIIQRDKVTYFAGVPTMYFYLLNHPEASKYDLSSLRLCISGGSSMPVEVLLAFNKKYNVKIMEGYGLSETAPIASFNHRHRDPKPGSIGTPLWGVDMKLVGAAGEPVLPGEMGEIVVRGHNVMKGYYKRPTATAEAIRHGWFHTGDLAKMDEEGYYFIVDRVKDMIIRGGFNVYPREVEEILYAHPAVAEVAVIGVPDPALGEEIKAVVACKPGQHADEQELIDYCKERLAAYKYPRSIEFREALPKTATGKILKRELK